jgi:predicted ribonuclease YlaK
MDKYLFLDTSAVMHAFNELEVMIEEGAKLVVCSTVLEELDRHKDGSNNEKKFKARKAFKLLNNHPKDVEYIVDEQPDKLIADTLFYGFDMKQPDNKILYACMSYMDNHDVEAILVTNDNGMVAKANLLQIPVMKMIKAQEEEMYKGFIELFGTEEENDNALYDLMDSGTLHANQYVILHDTDTEVESAVRWDAKLQEFVDIKYRTAKVKPLNIYQECAMDLLYNDSIPIKVIAGNYGSGKSLLSMKIMEEKIYTGLYDKMLLLRNPIAVDAIDIGALPGDFHSKLGHFFSPMVQYLTNDTMFDYKEAFDPKNEEAAKRRGYQLDMDIVQNLKGVSVDRTIVVLDEAEDLSLKLIKVAGTRIGRGSMLVMMGDIKNQTEDKYKYDNGLAEFIEYSKDEPLVGVIYLPHDVRSEMSRIFAELGNK